MNRNYRLEPTIDLPALESDLFEPELQAMASDVMAERSRRGIEEAWQKVWDLPLPFYRSKYEAVGLRRDELPPLDEIPTTVKQELRDDQAANPPFGTHRSASLDRAVRLAMSGGTSGDPFLLFYGPADQTLHNTMGRRQFWRAGLRPGDRLAHCWPSGLYGASLAPMLQPLRILEIRNGPPGTVEGGMEHIRLWQLLEPNAFMMTGSQLSVYEQAAEAMNVDLAEIMAGASVVLMEASCQFEGPRARLESALGIRVHNIGGASEIPAFYLNDCRYHTGLHAAGDHVVVQVCDPDTGRAVPDGVRGHLVVTGFGMDAIWIRYNLQDYVVVDHPGPCPCGETGPRYTYLGRESEAVRVDDNLVFPLDIQLALERIGAPEFQVVGVDDRGTLHLNAECDSASGEEIAAVVREALAGVAIAVEAVPRHSLPRSVFKPRRTV